MTPYAETKYGQQAYYIEKEEQVGCLRMAQCKQMRTHEEFNIRYNAQTGKVDLRDLETIKREKGII